MLMTTNKESRHVWMDKFRSMSPNEIAFELKVNQDIDNPELYDLLSVAAHLIVQLNQEKAQLYKYFIDTSEQLGVIPEQPRILKEIDRLKSLEAQL